MDANNNCIEDIHDEAAAEPGDAAVKDPKDLSTIAPPTTFRFPDAWLKALATVGKQAADVYIRGCLSKKPQRDLRQGILPFKGPASAPATPLPPGQTQANPAPSPSPKTPPLLAQRAVAADESEADSSSEEKLPELLSNWPKKVKKIYSSDPSGDASASINGGDYQKAIALLLGVVLNTSDLTLEVVEDVMLHFPPPPPPEIDDQTGSSTAKQAEDKKERVLLVQVKNRRGPFDPEGFAKAVLRLIDQLKKPEKSYEVATVYVSTEGDTKFSKAWEELRSAIAAGPLGEKYNNQLSLIKKTVTSSVKKLKKDKRDGPLAKLASQHFTWLQENVANLCYVIGHLHIVTNAVSFADVYTLLPFRLHSYVYPTSCQDSEASKRAEVAMGHILCKLARSLDKNAPVEKRVITMAQVRDWFAESVVNPIVGKKELERIRELINNSSEGKAKLLWLKLEKRLAQEEQSIRNSGLEPNVKVLLLSGLASQRLASLNELAKRAGKHSKSRKAISNVVEKISKALERDATNPLRVKKLAQILAELARETTQRTPEPILPKIDQFFQPEAEKAAAAEEEDTGGAASAVVTAQSDPLILATPTLGPPPPLYVSPPDPASLTDSRPSSPASDPPRSKKLKMSDSEDDDTVRKALDFRDEPL